MIRNNERAFWSIFNRLEKLESRLTALTETVEVVAHGAASEGRSQSDASRQQVTERSEGTRLQASKAEVSLATT